MSEQITILHDDGSVTIIATMTPSDGTPPPDREPGLQLIEQEEEES